MYDKYEIVIMLCDVCWYKYFGCIYVRLVMMVDFYYVVMKWIEFVEFIGKLF